MELNSVVESVVTTSDISSSLVDKKKKYRHFPYPCEICNNDCKFLPLLECSKCKAVVCSIQCKAKLKNADHKSCCYVPYTSEEEEKLLNGRSLVIFGGEELLPFPLFPSPVPVFAIKASELDTVNYRINIDPIALANDLYLVRKKDIKRFTKLITKEQWDHTSKFLVEQYEANSKFKSDRERPMQKK